MKKIVLTATAVSLTALLAACGSAAKQAPGAGSAAPPSTAPAPASGPATGPTATSGVDSGKPAASGAALPGRLYYQPDGGGEQDFWLARLAGGKLVGLVPRPGTDAAMVSPDGTHIAVISGPEQTLRITDADGTHGRSMGSGFVAIGFEPAWSPAGDRVLVTKRAAQAEHPGVVTVATGAFTPLAHDPHGIHYLWSADGKHLVYATGECRIGVADADGGNARLVPNFGSMDRAVNPHRERSCDPFSVSPDGKRVAIDLRTGDQEDGDIGPDWYADAILDLATGKTTPVPVHGSVTQILFQPDGRMLVRAHDGGKVTLTLFAANGQVTATVTEPAAAAHARLLAYRA
jgi:hypothetical protein